MHPIRKLLHAFWLPVLMLVTYALMRLFHIRTKTDLDGMSAVWRILFCGFGASIAYFMTFLPCWKPFDRAHIGRRFWVLSTLFLMILIADDGFMIHESIGFRLKIPDSVPFLAYGALLGVLVLVYRRRLRLGFWLFLCGFGLCSIVSTLGDMTAHHEGVLTLAGVSIDYEQICEMIGILFLASGFTLQAIQELVSGLGAAMDQPRIEPAAY